MVNMPGHLIPSPGLPHPQDAQLPGALPLPAPARPESCSHPREPCGRGAAGGVSGVSGDAGRPVWEEPRSSETFPEAPPDASQLPVREARPPHDPQRSAHVGTGAVTGGEAEAWPSGWHGTQTSSHPPPRDRQCLEPQCRGAGETQVGARRCSACRQGQVTPAPAPAECECASVCVRVGTRTFWHRWVWMLAHGSLHT